MSFADRVDRALDERDHELWDEHEAGDHGPDPDAGEPDCARCQKDQRDRANFEGDPAFNGAFAKW